MDKQNTVRWKTDPAKLLHELEEFGVEMKPVGNPVSQPQESYELYQKCIDKVDYYLNRISELSLEQDEVTVVILNINYFDSLALSETFMGVRNWNKYRYKNQIPLGIGLIHRFEVLGFIEQLYPDDHKRLEQTSNYTVLVFTANQLREF